MLTTDFVICMMLQAGLSRVFGHALLGGSATSKTYWLKQVSYLSCLLALTGKQAHTVLAEFAALYNNILSEHAAVCESSMRRYRGHALSIPPKPRSCEELQYCNPDIIMVHAQCSRHTVPEIIMVHAQNFACSFSACAGSTPQAEHCKTYDPMLHLNLTQLYMT